MPAHEEKKTERKNAYNPPEIVRLGDARELTAGGDGTLADGGLQVPHWKDVSSCSAPPPEKEADQE